MEKNQTSDKTREQNPPQFQNSIPVEIERRFQAPVEKVWKAWTTPELVKQWWGPAQYSCPEAPIDFREGGKYNFAMKGPDQKVNWSGGTYKKIVPNEKIICTDHFTDQEGNSMSAQDFGMPGEWPEELYVTIQFEKVGHDECHMSLRHEGIPKEMHNDCTQGWNTSIDKLQQLVEHH